MSALTASQVQAAFRIDRDIAACLAIRPNSRPGERDLHGAPYVFNADLLRSFEARELVYGAPADLSSLSDTELEALRDAAQRRWFDTSGEATASDVSRRAWAETEARVFFVTACERSLRETINHASAQSRAQSENRGN